MSKFGELIDEKSPLLLAFYSKDDEVSESMHPVLKDVAAAIGDKGKVIKIDVDKNQKLSEALRVKVIPTMMIYKAKVNSRGFLDKLKWRCVARGDLQQDLPAKETWSATIASLTMKLFFANTVKLGKVRQLDYVGAFLQVRCKNRIFVRLPVECAKHFLEYAKYFSQPLLLKKTIYGLTVSAKWWADELTDWLVLKDPLQI